MESVYADMHDSEKLVASYLKELGLWWSYETPVFVYDEKERPRVWTPDFYLPKFGMYIEVCGSEDFDYKYREKIYQDNSLHVIFVHAYKDPAMWKKHLVTKMLDIEEERHTQTMRMIRSFSLV